MPTWNRAYGADQDDRYALRYVAAGGMSVAGLLPLCGLTVDDPPGATGIAAVVLFVSMWQVMLWRITLVGLYVSEYGVKIRAPLRTRVIPWPRVTRAWAGRAADHDAWQIWISTRDPERDIETPIWRRGSRARHRNRVVLSPDEFAAVLNTLNSHR